MAITVGSVDGARGLALWLTHAERKKRVVVITTSAVTRRPFVDVATVDDGVGTLADVWVLPTGRLTWEFQAQLPPRTEV